MDNDVKMARIHKLIKEYYPNKIVEINTTDEEIFWSIYDIPTVSNSRKKKTEGEELDGG